MGTAIIVGVIFQIFILSRYCAVVEGFFCVCVFFKDTFHRSRRFQPEEKIGRPTSVIFNMHVPKDWEVGHVYTRMRARGWRVYIVVYFR